MEKRLAQAKQPGGLHELAVSFPPACPAPAPRGYALVSCEPAQGSPTLERAVFSRRVPVAEVERGLDVAREELKLSARLLDSVQKIRADQHPMISKFVDAPIVYDGNGHYYVHIVDPTWWSISASAGRAL
jgi:hypothetical protein